MAKIDKRKKTNKRKVKEVLEAESPTSKFKKLDISTLKYKTKTESAKEIVNKSDIISTQMSSPKKRKTPDDAEAAARKKTKISKSQVDSQDSDDDELHEPTALEINESLKPENIKSIETVRQKKRAKHQNVVELNKNDSQQREILRNVEYLNKWKSNRESWKFEKLRQISIQNRLFDEQQIDDGLWSLTVEYLSGTKGAARDSILKSAENVINDIESRLNETNKKEILSLKNYKRARELLQLLQ